MIIKIVKIKNKNGIHARPCSILQGLACKYNDTKIILYKLDASANANSVLELMMLAMSYNEEIKVEVCGNDENQVMEVICNALTEIYEYEEE